MNDDTFPAIKSEDDLFDTPAVAYLETAGRDFSVRLDDCDDAVDAARRLMERAPAERRFRLVTVQRFSLAEPAPPPEPVLGPQCGAMDALEDGVVRCELEAHSDGLHHAGRVLRDGRAGPVHYWRGTSADAP